MSKYEIIEVDSVDDAVTWLSDDDEYIGVVISLQLTGDRIPDENDFREAAHGMRSTCCGAGAGVFRIDGNLWYIYCDFGH